MQNEKLKILFISSWYPNKKKPLNGIFVKRHAEANLHDCDVSVVFVCSADTNSIEESMEDGLYKVRGYYAEPKIKIFPFYHLAKLIRYYIAWKKALTLYKTKKGKPQLINSNIVFPVSLVAVWLKFFWKVPYVITEHWTGYFPEDGNYKGFLKKMVTRIAAARASAVITVSNKLSDTMQSLGLKNNYFIIPNVVDPEIFSIKTNTEAKEEFSFIHISSMDDAQKNVSGIIRTFTKFHAAHSASTLTIVGNTDDMNLINKDSGISMLGKKEGAELATLLRTADAFVLFSNYENLPVVMLESFMCGLPVIGTRVGDVPEYINEKNGILIEPGNETQLLQAMEKILKNSSVYIPSEIRNGVIDKVSPIAISKQFTDIYKTCLNIK